MMERSHLRAGDEDRKHVVAELQRHYVEGRLSQDELDDRVGRALAARSLGELDELQRDLPSPGAPPASAPDAMPEAGSGPWGRREFRSHALTYLAVMALLVAIWLLTSPGGYFWPIWPMLGWGLGLALHGMASTGWLGSSSHASRQPRRRRRER